MQIPFFCTEYNVLDQSTGFKRKQNTGFISYYQYYRHYVITTLITITIFMCKMNVSSNPTFHDKSNGILA